MFNITINDKPYQLEEGLSIIQACENVGIKIPRFCYLKGLSIPANCRMCLVEVQGFRKLIPACHTVIANNMVIFTESEKVVVARKKIMAFLLINHPLDCPICDEAGECELQNQAIAYGFNKSYFEFAKRSRENKYLGPLISTYMNRCINCTRCIRFLEEVAGLYELGMINRSKDSDISNYFQTPIDSELSGNLVDVCPVGALNNAQYLFRERPWVLDSTSTIDIIDSFCPKITVNTHNNQVLRILPRELTNYNDVDMVNYHTWISDKTRYICDAVNMQRIESPWIRNHHGRLQPTTLEEAFAVLANQLKGLKGEEIAAFSGKFADAEGLLVLKELMQKLGSNLYECRTNDIRLNNLSSYLFNTGISNIEHTDCIILVGCNLKKESPVINSIVRKHVLAHNIPVFTVGKDINLNYPVNNIGESLISLQQTLFSNSDTAQTLAQAKNPMLILGEGAFIGQDSNQVQALINSICNKFNIVTKDWNGYNFISTSVGLLNGIAVNFTNDKQNMHTLLDKASASQIKLLWLYNLDEIDFTKLKNTFVVYVGHHGEEGAQHADVVLPTTLWLENSSTYINIEGKALVSNVVTKAPYLAKDSWKLFKLFADFIEKPVSYQSVEDVRAQLAKEHAVFANGDTVITPTVSPLAESNTINLQVDNLKLKDITTSSIITDYYLTDVISRNSVTLSKCSQVFTAKTSLNDSSNPETV